MAQENAEKSVFGSSLRKLRKARFAFQTPFASCEKPVLFSNAFRKLRKAHFAFQTPFASCEKPVLFFHTE
jgi:hypothetical protein